MHQDFLCAEYRMGCVLPAKSLSAKVLSHLELHQQTYRSDHTQTKKYHLETYVQGQFLCFLNLHIHISLEGNHFDNNVFIIQYGQFIQTDLIKFHIMMSHHVCTKQIFGVIHQAIPVVIHGDSPVIHLELFELW